MAQVEIAESMIQIDAEVLARAFDIGSEELKRRMREGTITSRAEHGEDEDVGRIRLTFFSPDHRVRITADAQGNVLSCERARIEPASPDGRWVQDALLDEALAESFPGSDPIAVSFDPNRRAGGN